MKDISSLKVTMNWKQAALYEMAMLSLGILIGSVWPEIFTGLVKITLLAIFALAGGYTLLVWMDQNLKASDRE